MKKFTKILAAGMACMLCFGGVACGGDGENGGTLTVTYQQGTTEGRIVTRLKNAFEAKKKEEGKTVKVKLVATSSNNYNSDILKGWETNALADVVYTYDEFAPVWAEKGVFENLDARFAASNFDFSAYDEAAFSSAKAYGGSIYYVPRSYDQPVVYVNRDLFTQYDIAVPTASEFTWTKLMEICDQLRKAFDNDSSLGIDAQYYYPLDLTWTWQPIYNAFVQSFGGYIYNGETDKVGFTESGTVKAFEKIREIIDNEYAPPTTGGGTNFSDKKAAMYIMSRPTVSNLEKYEIENVAFLPMPVFDEAFTGVANGKSYYCYGTTGYALNSNSKNKETAWEFMQFVMSVEGQTILSEGGLIVPIVKSMQNAENAAWKKGISFIADEDQSAFVFGADKESVYTRILATYARGNYPTKERTVYDSVNQQIQSLCSKTYEDETVAKFCADAQAAVLQKLA